MAKTRLYTYIVYLIFMLGIYLGFFYTLAMLTDVTTLAFYQDFLDPSVIDFVAVAQETNKILFNWSLILVVGSAITLILGYRKGRPGVISNLLACLVGLTAIVINSLSYQKIISLNVSYSETDTMWPEATAGLAELLGFVQPGNFWIGNGPALYLSLITCSAIFTLVSLIWVLRLLVGGKGK
ncbi:MAG: hypothetical protein JXB20_04765 [Bacilli bacterium]|nr:hypothetical protein [Bacilli bacterium]MBN2696727.1 hypothetical protein [Bacilli bacterium]